MVRRDVSPPSPRRGPLRTLRPLLGGVVLASLVVVAGCSSSKLDTTQAEEQMTARIRAEVAPAKVGEARCPEHVTPKKGATFTCHVEVAGADLAVTATQVDGKGSISVEPDRALVVVAKVQADLTAQLAAAYESSPDGTAPAVQVSCPGAPLRVMGVGESFECTASTPAGPTTERVVVKDTAGRVAYEPAG